MATEWYNPEEADANPLQGQYWQSEQRHNFYDKLPQRFDGALSQSERAEAGCSGGLSLRFRTSSPTIAIRYDAEPLGATSQATQPSQSMTEVYLYGTNNHGEVRLFEGDVACQGDTTTKTHSIEFDSTVHAARGYEYQLWLPALSGVERLEIGVEDGSFFTFKSLRRESPIVIYGSSLDCFAEGSIESEIAGWSAQLSMAMDRPIIDLTTLSDEPLNADMVAQLGEIGAKVFILNSPSSPKNGKKSAIKELAATQVESVKRLRASHPVTPILLSQSDALAQLANDGYRDIYLLDPSRCEADLREILHCPKGELSTMQPVVQSRAFSIEWHDHCRYILDEISAVEARGVVFGDSIVQNWGSSSLYPENTRVGDGGLESWNTYLSDFLNLGIGSDRVENLLWRLYNDQFDIKAFEEIIIMIGTNNLNMKSPYRDIAEGIAFLVEQIKVRQPEAHITVVGVLPRRDMTWESIQDLNGQIERAVRPTGVTYRDLGRVFLDENNVPRKELYKDTVHLSIEGYDIYTEALMGR